jgi:hypothetical protein
VRGRRRAAFSRLRVGSVLVAVGSEMTAELLYLSGGARVSTRPDTESLGPRSHVPRVVNALPRLGFRVRPYIVGD